MKEFDVIVIGGGPAGLSAAMYLTKAELSVLVIDDNRSIISSAWLLNTYLGVNDQLGDEFLTLATKQVQDMGAQFLNESVEEVREEEEHYVLKTKGGTFTATHLILASGMQFGVAELLELQLEENPEPWMKQRVQVDSRGRTSKSNVYAAGVVAGVSSQAIIAAGHGAQVALNLLSDVEEKRTILHDKKSQRVMA
jgi:thioredoxin reductase (NADPH)